METKELLNSIRAFHQWDAICVSLLHHHGNRPWDADKYDRVLKWRNEEAEKINNHFGEEVFVIITATCSP